MTSVTVQQIQKIDQLAIEQYGIPSLALMENAGQKTAAEVLRILARRRGKCVSILCGTGNNGGDGFVVARHLANAGINVAILVVGKITQLKKDAAVYAAALRKSGIILHEIKSVDLRVKKFLNHSDAVVDALFGVGLNRPLSASVQNIINVMNTSGKPIVAVDVPSGLDSDTGDIYGACVRAHTTVTFTLPKKGFFKRVGPQVTGKVSVVDIGIPKMIIKRVVK